MKQPTCPPKFSEYKIAASFLKGLRGKGCFSDDIYLDLFEKGEMMIDDDVKDTDMSAFTKQHLMCLNKERQSLIRKRNASIIIDGLDNLGIKPIVRPAETSTPLFIPITIPSRDAVRKKMFASKIFLPVHWPVGNSEDYSKHLIAGKRYAQEELSIIIDQRYGAKEMVRILETLEKAIR